MDSKQKGSEALQELVKALRRKGAATHVASWALVNAAKRDGKEIALTPAALQQRLYQQLGMNIELSTAEEMVALGDQGHDGKIGFNSWGRLLGNELQNVEVFRAPLSARPKSALSKPPTSIKTPRVSESPKVNRPISADRAKAQRAEQHKCVGRQKSSVDNDEVEKFLEAELNSVIGLDNVKAQLRQFVQNLKLDQRRRELCLLPEGHIETYDMVFYGNPGTGKTSIARLIPRLLERIGVIQPGAPFAEVGRQDLVGAYIGSTEEKTQKRIEDSRGGVLFIDEAYTLTEGSGGRDFGIKALETIMQCMTSEDRSRPVFIFAGYQAQMESFLLANPGMARRVAYKFHFEDYTPAQLAEIAARKAAARGFTLTDGARRALPLVLGSEFTPAARALWNGGLAARLISESVQCLNARLDPAAATKSELCTLEERDVKAGARAAAAAVTALQAVTTPAHGAGADDGDGSPRRRPPVPTGAGASAAAGAGRLPVSTMHLKEYWPSAMLRIAALEEELIRARRAEDDAAAPHLPPGAAAGESSRGSPRDIAGPSTSAAAGHERGDEWWHGAVRAVRQAAAAVEAAATSAAGTGGRGGESCGEEAERLVLAALELVRAARAASRGASPCSAPPPGEPSPAPALQVEAARQRESAKQDECAAAAAAAAAAPAVGGGKHAAPAAGCAAAAAASEGEGGLGDWLAGVRADGLRIGDGVPRRWAEGTHYTFGAVGGAFAVGDTVVAVRSDGRLTFASVAAVRDVAAGAGAAAGGGAPAAGAGTLELLVGMNLQKATAAERVGRLHAGLGAFLAHRRAVAAGGAEKGGWCAPAGGAGGAWMDGLDAEVVTGLVHLDADERRRT